ncbi:MAG: ABC transporter permease [Brachybacterium sp.]|nr:ABC transporter permease [Brachybacterium sp.]
MFVALRDLRFARGRFALIGSVVALITILVGFLSGLTGGLAQQNISAILAMPGDRIVFSEPHGEADDLSFSDSQVTAADSTHWEDAAGVSAVQPIGISQLRAESADARASVAVFGVESDYSTAAPSHEGTLTLTTTVASDLEVTEGDTVTIAGTDYTVGAVTGDESFSHTPVVLMPLGTWQELAERTGTEDAYASVFAVTGSSDTDYTAIASGSDTVAESTLSSLTALPAFQSEIGSLLTMVAMLFGISALVIGAFFVVWTMQRSHDIAVLKALGASTRSLITDALGQALVVLLTGIGVGIAVVGGLGALASGVLPFWLSPLTTLLPGAIMALLGLAGAAFALRSVTSTDPLTALGSNR